MTRHPKEGSPPTRLEPLDIDAMSSMSVAPTRCSGRRPEEQLVHHARNYRRTAQGTRAPATCVVRPPCSTAVLYMYAAPRARAARTETRPRDPRRQSGGPQPGHIP